MLKDMMDDINNRSLESIQLENEMILRGEIKPQKDKKENSSEYPEHGELHEVCRG